MISILIFSMLLDAIILAIAALILVRRKYRFNVLVHRRVVALMAQYSNTPEQQQSGYDKTDRQKIFHRASPMAR